MSSERSRKSSHLRSNSVPETPTDVKRINKKWQLIDEPPKLNFDGSPRETKEVILYRNECIVIKQSEGKGFGVFAAKDLPRGTRILEEKPMILLSNAHYGEKDIVSAFIKLSDKDQENFMALSCQHMEDECKIAAIFNWNCYKIGDGAAIFTKCSRINHACVPTAHVSWNENINRQTCHLLHEVVKGDEITVNYIASGTKGVVERQEALRSYGFTCECEVCVPSTRYGRGSETRRKQIGVLSQKIDEWWAAANTYTPTSKEHEEAKHHTRELARLLREEGLVGPELAEAFNAAYECAMKRHQVTEAYTWAKLELEVDTYTVGLDSTFIAETNKRIARMEKVLRAFKKL